MKQFRRSVPNGKRGQPLEVVDKFRTDFPENYVPFDFQPECVDFLAKW